MESRARTLKVKRKGNPEGVRPIAYLGMLAVLGSYRNKAVAVATAVAPVAAIVVELAVATAVAPVAAIVVERNFEVVRLGQRRLLALRTLGKT
jgi:hypothetical protein